MNGAASPNLDLAYDTLGNITSKSDVGSYTYHATKKHRLISTSNGWSFDYDANGNVTSSRGATISWTSFNRPLTITNGSNVSTFSYTPDRQYWKQQSTYTVGGESTSIYIGGLLEKVTTGTTTDYRHMIRAGNSTIVVSRRTSGINSVSYMTSDHLGSSSAITNEAGQILVNSSFDAFGKRRGANWTGSPSQLEWNAIASTTRRGYTEHSMLDNLNLTHMNGRVYDQLLGKFLSADPFVPEPLNTQSYNRYSYVFNNPLSATDPTGFETTGPTIPPGPDMPRPHPCYVGFLCPPDDATPDPDYRDPTDDGTRVEILQNTWSWDACYKDLSRNPVRSMYKHIAITPEEDLAERIKRSRISYVLADSIIGNTIASFRDDGLNPISGTFLNRMEQHDGRIMAFLSVVTGPLGRAVQVGKGLIPSVGGVIRQFEQQGARIYYRVFSGEATTGRWLTAVPPRGSAWAQEALGLPPWNRATHIQEVLVPDGTLLQRSRAIPVPEWGRSRAAAEQFELLETIPPANFGSARPLP